MNPTECLKISLQDKDVVRPFDSILAGSEFDYELGQYSDKWLRERVLFTAKISENALHIVELVPSEFIETTSSGGAASFKDGTHLFVINAGSASLNLPANCVLTAYEKKIKCDTNGEIITDSAGKPEFVAGRFVSANIQLGSRNVADDFIPVTGCFHFVIHGGRAHIVNVWSHKVKLKSSDGSVEIEQDDSKWAEFNLKARASGGEAVFPHYYGAMLEEYSNWGVVLKIIGDIPPAMNANQRFAENTHLFIQYASYISGMDYIPAGCWVLGTVSGMPGVVAAQLYISQEPLAEKMYKSQGFLHLVSDGANLHIVNTPEPKMEITSEDESVEIETSEEEPRKFDLSAREVTFVDSQLRPVGTGDFNTARCGTGLIIEKIGRNKYLIDLLIRFNTLDDYIQIQQADWREGFDISLDINALKTALETAISSANTVLTIKKNSTNDFTLTVKETAISGSNGVSVTRSGVNSFSISGASLMSLINALQANLNSLSQALDSLEASTGSHTTTINSLTTTINNLSATIGSLQATMNSLALTAKETAISSSDSSVSVNRTGMNEFDLKVAGGSSSGPEHYFNGIAMGAFNFTTFVFDNYIKITETVPAGLTYTATNGYTFFKNNAHIYIKYGRMVGYNIEHLLGGFGVQGITSDGKTVYGPLYVSGSPITDYLYKSQGFLHLVSDGTNLHIVNTPEPKIEITSTDQSVIITWLPSYRYFDLSVAPLKTLVESLQAELNSLADALDSLEAAVSSHTTTISSLVTTTNNLSATIGSLQATVNSLSEFLDSLEATVNSHTTTINNLSSTVNSHTTTINSLTTTTNNLQTTVNQQQTTINNLQTTVNQQQTTINNLETVIEQQNTTINNLIEQVEYVINNCCNDGQGGGGAADNWGTPELVGGTYGRWIKTKMLEDFMLQISPCGWPTPLTTNNVVEEAWANYLLAMGLNGRALADVVKIAERELGLARAGSGNPALLTQEGFWQYLNDICAQVVGMRWDDILSNFDPYLIFPRWPDCALGVGVYG